MPRGPKISQQRCSLLFLGSNCGIRYCLPWFISLCLFKTVRKELIKFRYLLLFVNKNLPMSWRAHSKFSTGALRLQYAQLCADGVIGSIAPKRPLEALVAVENPRPIPQAKPTEATPHFYHRSETNLIQPYFCAGCHASFSHVPTRWIVHQQLPKPFSPLCETCVGNLHTISQDTPPETLDVRSRTAGSAAPS